MKLTEQLAIILLSFSLLFLKVQPFCPTSVQKTFTSRPLTFFTVFSKEGGGTFESLTVAQLKDELRSRGLKITGKKEELLERLESHEMTTMTSTTSTAGSTTATAATSTDDDMIEVPIEEVNSRMRTASLSDFTTFRDLGIVPQLLTSIDYQGWEEPTPIQKLAVPEILKAFQEDDGPAEGDDIASIWAEAPTGSGKTGAFAIPIIQLTMENRKKEWNQRNKMNDLSQERRASVQVNLGRGRRFLNENNRDTHANKGFVSTLILCPTRELAVQIGGVIEELVEAMPSATKQKDNVDVLVITGGVPMEPQIQMLAERKRNNRDVDILVATPGRLADVLSRSAKEDTVEKELETKLLQALDMVGGKRDASLSLARIEKMEINKSLATKDDGGRSAIQDMLSRVRYLVLDEADRLLSQGFKAEMDEVLNLLPSASKNNSIRKNDTGRSKLKTLLFSATFPEQIQPRVENVLQRLNGKDAPPPLRLSCSSAGYTTDAAEQGEGEQDSVISNRKQKRLKKTTQPQIVFEGPASTIDLRTICIEDRDRTSALRRLLDQYGEKEWDRVLVFVGTRYAAEHVARKLRRYNIKASELHGKLDQDARIRRLEDFKKGKIRVLIATDLASRGLDVQGLPAVVNYDLPRSTADFTHRVGRTGRAGNTGTAVTFVTPTNEAHYDLIEKRHFGGANAHKREVLPGFEPNEARWEVARSASTIEVEGVQHSDAGLAHDRMFGGVKGRRKSKKDKIREMAAKKAVSKKTN
jgi:superfamily II DNA/RNA helicase